LIEKYKVEEKVLKPKADKKDEKGDDKKEEDEYEIKVKEKTRHTDIKCEISAHH